MGMNLKDCDRKIDETKGLLDGMYAELDDLAHAMAVIYDLAYDADEDNWKDKVDRIQAIAENRF